jgi:predicted SAM-dependent methyltransferase
MTTPTVRAMRVNLGSGDYPAAGWTNVDHESPHPHDVTADLTCPLPAELVRIGQVYAGHVLEHLHPQRVVTLLAELRDRMAPGGQIMAVGPDVTRARAMHARGELDDEWLRLVVEGGDRWPGDRHLWECEPVRLAAMLNTAGWRMAREVPLLSVSQINWPVVNYAEWQCAVTAYA